MPHIFSSPCLVSFLYLLLHIPMFPITLCSPFTPQLPSQPASLECKLCILIPTCVLWLTLHMALCANASWDANCSCVCACSSECVCVLAVYRVGRWGNGNGIYLFVLEFASSCLHVMQDCCTKTSASTFFSAHMYPHTSIQRVRTWT